MRFVCKRTTVDGTLIVDMQRAPPTTVPVYEGSGLDKVTRQKLILSFGDGTNNCGQFQTNGEAFVGPIPNADGTKLYFIAGKDN